VIEIPSWREADGVEVWLVADDSATGLIDGLESREDQARSRATAPAVFGANTAGDDAARAQQLLAAGYARVFSMVRMERSTSDPPPAKPITTRAATLPDAQAMLRLTEQVWAARPRFTMPTLDDYSNWLVRSDLSLFRLVHDGDTLIASIAGIADSDGAIEIDDIMVHPDRQRRGIGASLITGMLTQARRRGVTRVWLSTDGDHPVGARTLYARLGFTVTDERLRFRKPIDHTVDPLQRS
jgi:GNAT superfamily N-acetyltransferase